MAATLESTSMYSEHESRKTGPFFGAFRLVGAVLTAAFGALHIGVVGNRRGEDAAQKTFAQYAKSLCNWFGLRVHVHGELPPDSHEVRVANHMSYLDVLAFASVGSGRFLSRHDVETWPIVGRVAKACGTVFVERDSPHGRASAFRSLAKTVKEGKAIVVFPEGHTNVLPKTPFQIGAFAVARVAKVPVRPVALLYSNPLEAAWVDDTPLLQHAFRRLSGDWLSLEMVVMPTIDTQGKDPKTIAREAESLIVPLLDSNREQALA